MSVVTEVSGPSSSPSRVGRTGSILSRRRSRRNLDDQSPHNSVTSNDTRDGVSEKIKDKGRDRRNSLDTANKIKNLIPGRLRRHKGDSQVTQDSLRDDDDVESSQNGSIRAGESREFLSQSQDRDGESLLTDDSEPDS
jgi:hypothetical protein